MASSTRSAIATRLERRGTGAECRFAFVRWGPQNATVWRASLGWPTCGPLGRAAGRGEAFIAWQQNSRVHPGHYDVYARPLGGGEKFKVNASTTNGANGEIDGDRLVYQQFKRGASDLKLFDLFEQKDAAIHPAA